MSTYIMGNYIHDYLLPLSDSMNREVRKRYGARRI